MISQKKDYQIPIRIQPQNISDESLLIFLFYMISLVESSLKNLQNVKYFHQILEKENIVIDSMIPY